MLGLNESPFLVPTIEMLRSEFSTDEMRVSMSRARAVLHSDTVTSGLERERAKIAAKRKREAEIKAKAERSRRPTRARRR